MQKFFMALTLALTSVNLMAQSPKFNPKRLVIKLKDGVSMPQVAGIKKVTNLFGNVFVLHTENAAKLEKSLKGFDGAVYIEKDYYAKKHDLGKPVHLEEVDFLLNGLTSLESNQVSVFNDPMVSKQWTFRSAARHGVSVIDAYETARTQARTKIIVAVVDTGVDYNHEDLKDVMWTNPGEIANNGIDDDNNGYIDDIHGINTLIRDNNGKATSEPMDGHGHGSHVSGSIGATQNNNTGIAGIASNVAIMAIRTVPNRSDELDVDVAEAFIYAAKNGAKLINCSFGKANNENGMLVSDTIKYIGEKYGVLVIAAAGNDSKNIDRRLSYPASFENKHLFVIAASDSRGRMSYFSNFGIKNVDVAAPGSGILSSIPPKLNRGKKYASWNGTSMATPNTVGVAAEVLSHNPTLGPLELKQVLMDSVTKVGEFSSQLVTGGRIDLKKALELAEKL